VDATPAHVDRLQPFGPWPAHRVIVAFANAGVIPEQPPERRKRQIVADDMLAVIVGDMQCQSSVRGLDLETIGAAFMAKRREGVGFEKVDDRERLFTLDARISCPEGAVEGDITETVLGAGPESRLPSRRFRTHGDAYATAERNGTQTGTTELIDSPDGRFLRDAGLDR